MTYIHLQITMVSRETGSTSETAPMATPPSPMPSSSHLLIVKLTHNNFLLWKAWITLYFKGQNLYNFFDGSHYAPSPIDSTTNKPSFAFLTWQQQDQSIISILFASLSENLISHVLGATTSYEIWLILDDLFAAKKLKHVPCSSIINWILSKWDWN